VIAIAISSIIPGWRLRSSERAPLRNGHPAQKNTTDPRMGQVDAGEVEVVAEPVHDHRAGHDDGHGEGEAPPEALLVDGDVIAMVVMRVPAVVGFGVVVVLVHQSSSGGGRTQILYPLGVWCKGRHS
jgi:hypothetical protein